MHISTSRHWTSKVSAALVAILLLPFLYSGHDNPNQLQQVYQRGYLTLLTRNGASSYFIGPEGATGPEYDIVAAFANHLGLDLKVEIASEFRNLGALLESREGDLIAANLTRTPAREKLFSFGPDYAETSTIVVYKRGKPRPRKLSDLVGMRISVIAGSSYEDLLKNAREELPGLQWTAEKGRGIEDLLLAVADGELDATLVDLEYIQDQQPVLSTFETWFHACRPPAAGLGFPAGR